MGALHADLVTKAAAWLKAKRCSVVITDMVSSAGETPDAIGFNSFRTILIECKASRADFRADALKASRHHGRGMGNERYFLAVAGVLKPEEMPEGWGLLEVWPEGNIRQKRAPVYSPANREGEMSLLVSAIRRIGQNPPTGVSIKCYTMETKGLATISIDPEPLPEDPA